MRRIKAALAAALCVAFVAAAVPGIAVADETKGDVSIQGTTYDIDNYDASGMGDDTPALSHDITAQIADYGGDYTESHTLDLVNGASGDVDWVKFTVTSDDLLDKASFLIRVQSTMNLVDSVVEVYGPHATTSFVYTDGWLSGGGDSTHTSTSTSLDDDDDWRPDNPTTGTPTRDSCVVFRPTAAGTYYVRVRPYSASGLYQGEAGSYTLHMKRGLLQRAWGADRFLTAVEVSRYTYEAEAAPNGRSIDVVVANAFNFPDALGGSVLAGIGDGPLLLTYQDSLPAAVGAEISRIGAQRVYVVGGTSVVSDTVVTQLQNLPGHPAVYRVAGDDRYVTAVEIALQAQSDHGGYGEDMPTLAIIAYGQNFPDALAASALSAGRNVPILLTGSATLQEDTSEAMYHLGTTDVVIVGGKAVISQNVENHLVARFGAAHVLRIAGDNRYETAKEFAAWACDLKGPGAHDDGLIGTTGAPNIMTRLDPWRFGIASGENFPDALAGGAACGSAPGPLLLNAKANPYGYLTQEHDGALPAGDTDWVGEYHALYPTSPFLDGFVFGGPAALTADTMAILDNSLMLVNAP